MDLIDSLTADIDASVIARKKEMCLMALQLQHETQLTCDKLLSQYYTALFSYVQAKLRLHRERKRNVHSIVYTDSLRMCEHQVCEYKQKKNNVRDQLITLGIDPEAYKSMNREIQKKLK